MTDHQLTAKLRSYLSEANVVNPESYEWYDGEPLYLGEPVYCRATPSELLAFQCVYASLPHRCAACNDIIDHVGYCKHCL